MPWNDVQSFIDLSRKAETAEQLSHLLDSITREMGFTYYALIHHVDVRTPGANSALWLENYPRHWAEVFVNTGLYADDPILLASQVTNVCLVRGAGDDPAHQTA